MNKEKQLVIALLTEKIEKATGKKVVFEDVNAEKIKALVEKLEKISGKQVVLEDVENPEELEEGLFGAKSPADVQKEFQSTIAIWGKKGYIAPTPAEFQAIMTAAAADKYAGKLGVDTNKKIIYRPATAIKWAAPGGHTFGGGA